MRYSDIKDDWKNISRCVSFRIIEEVVDYNQGIMFEEYTRYYGFQLFVIYEDGKVSLTNNENDASIFFETDNPQEILVDLVSKIKNNEIKGQGVEVIEYNELHKRSSECLHFPNWRYSDRITPLRIYKGYSVDREKALERKSENAHYEAFDELLLYINTRGWELTEEDWGFIDHASTPTLIHMLRINRGSDKFRKR